MFDTFLHWLESTAPAIAISESSWLFPGIESVHVVAIALVVGSISMVDLRLLDVNLRDRPVGELTAEVLPWTWASFAVAVCTGALMFSSNATHYWGTVPFRAKMLPPLETRVGRKQKLIARSRERFATPRATIEDQLNRWMNSFGRKDL